MPDARADVRPEKLARSGGISLIGSAFAAVVALVLTAFVGNATGAAGTGLFFQAIGVFTIVTQVLKLGTNSAIVRQIAAQRAFGRRGEAWRTVVVATVPVVAFSAVVGVCFVVFADQLALWLSSPGQEGNLAGQLRAMAPFIACAAVLGVLQTAARMLRGVVAFTVLQSILLPLSRLFAVAAAILVADGVSTVFLGWMLPLPLWLIVTIGVLAHPLVVDWKARRLSATGMLGEARSFWSYSSARAVGAALETALEWSDVLIVAAITSPAEAGIYAVATRAIRAGQVVDRAMRIAVSPTISAMLARGEREEARELHTSVTRAMILATWPYYLVLATMGPAVLSIFGPEFRGGAVVMMILAAAMMVQSAAGMLQSILLQGGRSSWQMYNKALALAISVGLNLLLVPVLGIVGAAATWAFGVLVETTIAAWQVHRRMGVSLEPARLGFAMAAALGIVGVGGAIVRFVWGPTVPALLVGGVVIGVVYAAVLVVFRARLGIRSVIAELPLLRRLA